MKTITFHIWKGSVRDKACQSMTATLTGFLLMAPPTARTALGFPAISARRLYETVSPNFTSLRSACSTRLVNASLPQSVRQTGRVRDSSSLNQSTTDSWLTYWKQDSSLVQHKNSTHLKQTSTLSLIQKFNTWKKDGLKHVCAPLLA